MMNNLKSFTSPINIVLKYRLLLKYFSWVCSSSVLIVPKISNCYHNRIFEYQLMTIIGKYEKAAPLDSYLF